MISDLKKDVKAQTHLHSMINQGGALQVDAVTNQILMKMPKKEMGQFIDFLSKNPGGPGNAWTSAQLRKVGFIMPDGLKNISIKKGKIVGRMVLSKGLVWNSGSLFVSGITIPQTIVESMPGKSLLKVIEHPLLSETGEITKAMICNNFLRLKINVPVVSI